MYLRVMQAGFSADDVGRMSLVEAMSWLDAWDWLRTPYEMRGDVARMATQGDIDMLLA